MSKLALDVSRGSQLLEYALCTAHNPRAVLACHATGDSITKMQLEMALDLLQVVSCLC